MNEQDIARTRSVVALVFMSSRREFVEGSRFVELIMIAMGSVVS